LDSRIDIQLVESTAEHFAHGALIFVGVQTEPTHLNPLRKHPNIHFVPPLSRRDVVAATMAADVALVPHVRNALTEAMSPLKLYEALAGGLPVAAVDLSPMRGIDDRVVLANGERGFADAAMEALRIGRAPEEDRQSFVRANAWPRRHEEIIDFVLR
jgi:hypothetical protein